MERLHIIELYVLVTILILTYSASSVCVDSCSGKSDGNYQYCPDCQKYVACSNGYKYIMPCPANLVWDDTKRRCEWTSSTCTASIPTRTTTSVRRTTPNIQPTTDSSTECVHSCFGKSNGNYQYCPDCRKYVTCSNGYKYIMPCPADLVWDDKKKQCEWNSPTCQVSPTTRTSTPFRRTTQRAH
ncbi:hypothetical protein CHS0354_005477 [Potamilus streckersoni]|uniref:Chitin-binding type-2 domain-containing protein n=1 Tax=Potamilus streckersoni TaxID=2493646 RepID=A0AAE0SFH5_9BIVA|nr:hypothetical protein CHS0354_005477 [Potamilus streckersoni]